MSVGHQRNEPFCRKELRLCVLKQAAGAVAESRNVMHKTHCAISGFMREAASVSHVSVNGAWVSVMVGGGFGVGWLRVCVWGGVTGQELQKRSRTFG